MMVSKYTSSHFPGWVQVWSVIAAIFSFSNMAGAEPLLTVAIPTFNSAHFLPDAVASIMRQGLDDFEILIVDNASEDNTEEVVRSFENRRIRYIRNPSNLGACENGNCSFS